jgi:hypothetical protein
MSNSPTLSRISLAGLLLIVASAAQASIVTCASRNDSYQSCPVDTSHGVRLSRQLSSQGCWEGDTWGYDRNRIWVNRGCRAEFEVGATSSSASSANNAIAAAAVVGIAAAAIIASNKHDDHHKNKQKDSYDDTYDYGYSNSHYDNYYDRYDDGYYANTRYGYNGYRGDPRRVFNCESRGDRKNYCDIPKRGHVEVYKQLSASPCTYGRSWGVDGNSVWVTKGCRAEFAVF